MVQLFLQSITMGDRTVIDRAKDAPPGLLSELESSWKSFDANSREIAVYMLQRIDTPPSAVLLLRITADPALHVAAAAARIFERQSHLPSGDSILAAIPSRESPFIRGKLYLAAGTANCGLDALRAVAATERDPQAALHAQAAMVRRGGVPERLAFFERVRKTRADEVTVSSEHLFYVNDPNLAKAMIPWCDSTEGVARIGYDGGGDDRQARMCDFAVWNGAKLGLPTGAGERLTNYDPPHVSRVRKLYSELPDPKPE